MKSTKTVQVSCFCLQHYECFNLWCSNSGYVIETVGSKTLLNDTHIYVSQMSSWIFRPVL